MGFIFTTIFPNIELAQKFTCGKTKAMYLSCYSLAPHFHKVLENKVKNGSGYVPMFDETLNHDLQKKTNGLLG